MKCSDYHHFIVIADSIVLECVTRFEHFGSDWSRVIDFLLHLIDTEEKVKKNQKQHTESCTLKDNNSGNNKLYWSPHHRTFA